jgi:hypothetical protein
MYAPRQAGAGEANIEANIEGHPSDFLGFCYDPGSVAKLKSCPDTNLKPDSRGNFVWTEDRLQEYSR